jgi:hypothetical protein
MKLLVLIVRGLHAGAVGPYGNRWIDTPTLDALAAGGIIFDRHFAAHPDHAGARRVWRTGCFHFPQPDAGEPPGPWPDLLAVLAQQGVETRLILDAPAPSPPSPGWGHVLVTGGMDAALSAAHDALTASPGDASTLIQVELSALLPPWHIPERFVQPYFTAPAPAEEEPDEDEDEEDLEDTELQEEEDEEEPLAPIFDPPLGEIEEDDDVILAIQTTYAAAVSWMDSALGGLLGNIPDNVFVLLTADHGQALGEHGVVGPVRPGLHEEIVHVPLLLYGPGWRAGHRVSALTQSVDLAPTLAEFFGTRLEGTHGHSLLPLLGLEERTLRDYAGLGLRVGDTVQWALRTPAWALLLPLEKGSEPKLYVKPDDRCEVNDVAQHHLERADALVQTLRAFVQTTTVPGPLVVPPLPEEERNFTGP